MKVSMKSLSLAVAALTGFGMASAAFADCPADPAAPNGAWSSKTVTQANLAISTPGLASTSCALQVSLNQNSLLFAKSIVTDTSPQNEGRYRARFYINTAEITGLTSVLRSVQIFNASASTGPANLSGEEVSINLTGSTGAPTVVFTVADSTQGSGFRQAAVALPNAAGPNRVEFDLQGGASGSFRCWVSTDVATTDDGTPTPACTMNGINTTGWSGVTQASLGEFAANGQWRSNYTALTHIYLDEFDSRRQTFIGK
jgi:hypothetical protein